MPRLPVVFEPNAGRFDPHVEFAARTKDYRVLLSARGATFHAFASVPGRTSSISITPLRANPKAEISPDGELPFRTNYFLGSNKKHWRSSVPSYSRVRYRDIYPGIDLPLVRGATGVLAGYMTCKVAQSRAIRCRLK